MPIVSNFHTELELDKPIMINWDKLQFKFEASDAQKEILDYIFQNPTQNVIVNNVAGSGKTTLFMMLEKAIQLHKPTLRRLYLTYSKALADDNRASIGDKVRTVHSYAYMIMKKFLDHNKISLAWHNPNDFGRVSFINQDMTEQLVTKRVMEVYPGWQGNKDVAKSMWRSKGFILEIINDIRNNLIEISYDSVVSFYNSKRKSYANGDIEDAVTIVHQCLKNFVDIGCTDFDNLLYLVHIFKTGSKIRPKGFGMNLKHKYVDFCVPQLDLLCIDEVNDSFMSLRNFYQLVSCETTQIVAVGDPQQTIHVWAGTEIDCFDILREQINAKEFIFGTTYRINKSMCQYLNSSKLDLRMSTPDWSQEGVINENVKYLTMLLQAKAGDYILCRYNYGRRVDKPLSTVVIDLLELGKKITLLGNEYINGITRILKNADIDFNSKITEKLIKQIIINTVKLIEEEERSERPRAFVIRSLLDNLDITTKFISFYFKNNKNKTIKNFLHDFDEMLSNKNNDSIVLSSIHRAKGKETSVTWLLHGESIHSDMYNEDKDTSVEAANLMLVGLTRHTDEINIVEWELPDEF